MIKNCLVLCLVFFSGYMVSQNIERRQSVEKATIEYLLISGSQSAIYYGKQPEGHQPSENHPYLVDSIYAKAIISYRGVLYPEEMLLLDWNRNELLIKSPDNKDIVLFPESVDFAALHGFHIIYMLNDGKPGCPPTGYFIQLHSGNCRVLKRQTARLGTLESMSSYGTSSYTIDYIKSTQFYIYKDEAYYIIRNKRELLNRLHPHKKELKKYISNNHWQFKKDAEELITKTVIEYEKLSGGLQ